MNSWRKLKVRLKSQEPLNKHTTLRIGGPARYFANPADINELKLLLSAAKRANIPILILGAGSNILAPDAGVRALVISLKGKEFSKIALRKNVISAGCSVGIAQLVNFSAKNGLEGFENLSGIPGTVGGALYMNAGAWGSSIGDRVLEVTVMTHSGKVNNLAASKIKFGYRNSSLNKYIILGARFRLSCGNKAQISARIKDYLSQRKNNQDFSKPSAGCVFKNPQGLSAGSLIDACALKGKTYGGARISKKHANFILNAGGAKSRDVLRLMKLAQEKVRVKYKIKLEPEIKIWR